MPEGAELGQDLLQGTRATFSDVLLPERYLTKATVFLVRSLLRLASPILRGLCRREYGETDRDFPRHLLKALNLRVAERPPGAPATQDIHRLELEL